MAGGMLSSIQQRTGEVRTPSQSFVHALSGSHLGSWCMNSYRVRKTVGCSGGARISAMPAKCRDAYECGRGVCHFCNSVVVAARGRQMGQSTGDPGGHDLGHWVDGPMLPTCLSSGGQHRLQTWPVPAGGSRLACSFPRTCTCHLESITHQRERQNPAGQAQEGIERGLMHAPEATTGCRQSSMFQNIWNMHPLPRNLHVAFHIPNLGVTPQPPLHCLILLHSLPHLALGLASGQRNNQGRMNRAGRRKLFDGRAPLRRETHPGFTTHHAPPTWMCLGLLGLRNHGSTAEPACHCRFAAAPRFVCVSHTPNPDILALDRPIP